MRKFLQRKNEIDELYNAPQNRRLKYSAIAVIAVAVLLLLSMLIWIDKIPVKAMLFMRGCAGLGALIFVILIGIYHIV